MAGFSLRDGKFESEHIDETIYGNWWKMKILRASRNFLLIAQAACDGDSARDAANKILKLLFKDINFRNQRFSFRIKNFAV